MTNNDSNRKPNTESRPAFAHQDDMKKAMSERRTTAHSQGHDASQARAKDSMLQAMSNQFALDPAKTTGDPMIDAFSERRIGAHANPEAVTEEEKNDLEKQAMSNEFDLKDQ